MSMCIRCFTFHAHSPNRTPIAGMASILLHPEVHLAREYHHLSALSSFVFTYANEWFRDVLITFLLSIFLQHKNFSPTNEVRCWGLFYFINVFAYFLSD